MKHFIKNRYKPNKTDIVYYTARILGTKNYCLRSLLIYYLIINLQFLASLAEARAKLPKAIVNSDLSTTEDEKI